MSDIIINSQPTMVPGLMLQRVICRSCNSMLEVQPDHCVENIAEIERLAYSVHKQTNLICGTPKLIAFYGTVLVSADFAKAELPESVH